MMAGVKRHFLGKIGTIHEIKQESKELSVEWKIHNFRSYVIAGNYYSPDFNFHDACWCLQMYSNGYTLNVPSEYVDLFLVRKDKGPSLTIHVTIGIKGSERKGETDYKFSLNANSLGSPNYLFRSVFVLREHPSVLMPDNMITISCKMKIIVPNPHRDISTGEFKESRTSSGSQKLNRQGVDELQKSFLKLLESGKESDVVIKIKGKEFPAHRIILQARSTVFEAMFSHDMVEKQSGIVTMEDCDPETFPDFLKYVYTGSTDMISTKNVYSLYSVSDKYDLCTLKEQCADFIKTNLTVASFCKAITMAFKYNDRELIQWATEFFCTNTLAIVKTVEWQTFLIENPKVGNELFISSCNKKN